MHSAPVDAARQRDAARAPRRAWRCGRRRARRPARRRSSGARRWSRGRRSDRPSAARRCAAAARARARPRGRSRLPPPSCEATESRRRARARRAASSPARGRRGRRGRGTRAAARGAARRRARARAARRAPRARGRCRPSAGSAARRGSAWRTRSTWRRPGRRAPPARRAAPRALRARRRRSRRCRRPTTSRSKGLAGERLERVVARRLLASHVARAAAGRAPAAGRTEPAPSSAAGGIVQSASTSPIESARRPIANEATPPRPIERPIERPAAVESRVGRYSCETTIVIPNVEITPAPANAMPARPGRAGFGEVQRDAGAAGEERQREHAPAAVAIGQRAGGERAEGAREEHQRKHARAVGAAVVTRVVLEQRDEREQAEVHVAAHRRARPAGARSPPSGRALRTRR